MTRSVGEAVDVGGETSVGAEEVEQAASTTRVEVSIANKINRVGFIIYLIAKVIFELCKRAISDKSLAESPLRDGLRKEIHHPPSYGWRYS